jgi:peptidoglycan/LPS O-acetylase OafA/YrhL
LTVRPGCCNQHGMRIPSSARFRSLDSLRGIAAFLVVLTHCYFEIPESARKALPYLDFPLYSIAAAGRFCVMLFFVLSGFVLSLPYFAGKHPGYGSYLIRRFCRLYLPYAFAVLSAALLFLFIHQDPWPEHVLAAHLLMTGVGKDSTNLDSPIWTLIIEMRISIIFPILVWVVSRFGWWGVCAGVVTALFCCELNMMLGASGVTAAHVGQTFTGAVLLTVRYVPLFLFGIITAGRLGEIKRVLHQVPQGVHIAICICAIIVHVTLSHWEVEDHCCADAFYGLFASYLITSAVTFASFAQTLSGRLLYWLGDISYSLYLIHMPVIYAVLNIAQGHLRHTQSIAVAVPAVLLAGHLMHYLIERPSMMLGRGLARRFERSRG